ncbi:hypothetical protein, partial [Thermocrinis sp.]|uniref:hypothetical protein n=1 Tax=Thermocrinis sp. TaxID=2024383 RepID=UPI003C10A3A7
MKIKHFVKFFPHFRICGKTTHPSPPTHPLGTIFAGKNLVFSIHFCISGISGIKCVKLLKIKDLRHSASFSASIPHPFRKLAHCKKSHYNKAPPRPAHRPAVVRKLNNILHFS